MSDTDTIEELDPTPGWFRWDGRPSRRPLRVAGTGLLVRHPDTDPMTTEVRGEDVEVPIHVHVDDPELAGRMRADGLWVETDEDGNDLEADDDDGPFPRHRGGGTWLLSNGDVVRGKREDAEEAESAVGADETTTNDEEA